MRYAIFFGSLLCLALQVHGAIKPCIPSRVKFANLQLRITQGAKARIQEKLDGLTKSKKHFQLLVHKFDLFAPIIERVLKKEGVPDDFKYLVLQESTLVADLVSSADAVGFWQFKKPAALEVGLNINPYVDERKHIVAATHAAAKYLKKNYAHFHNWLYALLAYYEGRGGARKYVDKRCTEASIMSVAPDAHFYIIHFLAHKLAFRDFIGKGRHPQLYLYEYKEGHGKSLREISQEFGVDKKQLMDYNKWLKYASVPKDTNYPTIIPLTHRQYAQHRHRVSIAPNFRAKPLDYTQYWETADAFPTIIEKQGTQTGTVVVLVNGIPGVKARKGDKLTGLAKAGQVTLAQFLAYNDITEKCRPVPGQVYYYQAKHSRAGVHFHIARKGETWWSVAQKYGIKKKILLRKNRLRKEVPLEPGRVLWLRFIRPAQVPVAYEYKVK